MTVEEYFEEWWASKGLPKNGFNKTAMLDFAEMYHNQALHIHDVGGTLLQSLHHDLKGFQDMGFLTPDTKKGLGIAIEQVERYMRGDLGAVGSSTSTKELLECTVCWGGGKIEIDDFGNEEDCTWCNGTGLVSRNL